LGVPVDYANNATTTTATLCFPEPNTLVLEILKVIVWFWLIDET